MPIASSSTTYALVIVSLGILGVIVSFLIVDRKKYFIALGLSIFVVGMGLFQFANASFHQWRTARRIAKLQEAQRMNLETLQSKLREATERGRTGGAPVPAPVPAPTGKPAVTTTAPAHRRK